MIEKNHFLLKKKFPTTLVIINHYYGENKNFKGKSNEQVAKVRQIIVGKVIKELKAIPNADVKICGFSDKSLIDVDVDFSYIKNPSLIIYESIEWMFSQLKKYDYFINIEDDILLSKKTFKRIIKFDKRNPITECFHPNRIEYMGKDEYCVDLRAMPGWTDLRKRYLGQELRVALNPHSGLAILSKEKMLYAKRHVNLKRRDIIIGHYMASAYANLNSPFLLFRAYKNLTKHKVIHLDNWDPK